MSQKRYMQHRVSTHLHTFDQECNRLGCYPLVVIDPEDREQVERLMHLYCTEQWGHQFDEAQSVRMQAALREFANPKPPKPDEPTGLGAVVEDAEGKFWVRSQWDLLSPWSGAEIDGFNSDDDRAEKYRDLNVVRVLSDGVQAGESA